MPPHDEPRPYLISYDVGCFPPRTATETVWAYSANEALDQFYRRKIKVHGISPAPPATKDETP
jgi:hypothetical protein